MNVTSAMRTARRSYRPIFAQNLSTDGVRQLLGSYRKSANGAIVDDFKLQPGFLYTQVRAISARVNQNFDGWPSQELKKYYRTFLGKPVFVNHQNFDPTKARGRVVAARYVESGNDKFVEVIQEIDAQRFPKLAHEIRTGGLDSVSMGVEAGFTKCSVCDNKATDLHDMCSHVKYHKGKYLPHAKTGKSTLVYENCYKLGFFELSYVFDPADETAVVSKVLVANKRPQRRRTSRRIFSSVGLPGNSPDHPVGTPPEHYVIPYKGRGYSGEEVDAYRNLHSAKRNQGLWSLLAKNGPHAGRVIGHSDSVHMPNGQVFVNRAGADRVEDTQKKEVHAGVRGVLGPVPHSSELPSAPSGITYNPKAGDKFFWHRNEESLPREQRQPVEATEHVHLAPDGRAYAFDSSHFGRGVHPEVGVPEGGKIEPFYREGGEIHPRYQQIGRDAMRRFAYGEIEAPEDVDTLRNNDKTEDNQFHHYVESPRELRTPDMDNTIRQDQKQEEQGLDDGRRAEAVEELNPADGGKKIVEPDVAHEEVVNDFLDWCDSINVEPGEDSLDDFSNAYHLNNEDYQAISDFLESTESDGNGAGPTSNANQPVPHMSRRKMATYRYAEESQPPWLEDDSQGYGDDSQELGDGDYDENDEDVNGFSDSGGSDEDSLLEQLEQLPPEEIQAIIEQIQGDLDGDGDMDANPYSEYEEDADGDGDHDDDDHHYDGSDDYEDVDGDGDHDEFDHHADEFGGDNTGPMLQARRRRALSENYARPPVPGARVRDENGEPTFEDGDYEYWNDRNYDIRDQAAVDYGDHSNGLTRARGLSAPPEEREYNEDGWALPYKGKHYAPDQDEDQEFINGKRPLPGKDGMSYQEIMELMGRDRQASNGKSTTSSQKKRGTQKGKSMARETLASRGRKAASRQRLHRLANDNGHFDSGPYDENNQGEQEEIFISQTPGEEGLAAPVPGDGTISNTERNLVARINAQKNALQRDILAWNQIQQYKTAADGGIPDADTVNPELSGTDDQSLKGQDFERVQPDKVETQSKDASLKAFAAFDNWLRNTTGRTASQHGNANFIRRQAARWAGSNGYPVEVLFPALGNFLRQARRIEGGNMRRTADEKLEVAAPQDRIDVEAPVSDVTDAEAQASQFDLGDFGGNASDNVADPDLSTDSQIWAPGEGVKESNRKADGVAAIRLAEAYIRAGLKPEGEKYNLVAQFQTMRHATVTDRTRLLEAVLRTAAYNRRVTAGTNRGTAPRNPFPPGLMNGGGMSRSASVSRTAANDPSTDSDLFL